MVYVTNAPDVQTDGAQSKASKQPWACNNLITVKRRQFRRLPNRLCNAMPLLARDYVNKVVRSSRPAMPCLEGRVFWHKRQQAQYPSMTAMAVYLGDKHRSVLHRCCICRQLMQCGQKTTI